MSRSRNSSLRAFKSSRDIGAGDSPLDVVCGAPIESVVLGTVEAVELVPVPSAAAELLGFEDVLAGAVLVRRLDGPSYLEPDLER